MLVIMIIVHQATYVLISAFEPQRWIDRLAILLWLLLSILLLLIVTTGGFWFRSAGVRALIDDEVTRANRAESIRTGFIATMIGALVLYFLTFYEPVHARQAIHILFSIGIAAALLHFGFLERRTLADG